MIILAVLDVASLSRAAQPGYDTSFANEPFESFRLIDSQMTLLDSQLTELKRSLEPTSRAGTPGGAVLVRRPWRVNARAMRITLYRLERATHRLQAHYRARDGQRFGYQLFTRLGRREAAFGRRLFVLEQARTRHWARHVGSEIDKAMVAMVLEFQSISGGYGAAHCQPKAWACGEAKPPPSRKPDYPQIEVKWVCVQEARACRGLLGPRTPNIAPQPVTSAPRPAGP